MRKYVRSLAVVAEGSEERAIEVVGVAGGGEVGPDPLGRLRVDGHGVLLRSLADDAERIETAVPVHVVDCQACDFGPP